MIFDDKQFSTFLQNLSATKQQVEQIMASTPGADALSEAAMVLVFQSLFNVLMTTQEPKERLELAGTLKDIFSALNTRRDIERKSKNASDSASKAPLDTESLADLQARLKLL